MGHFRSQGGIKGRVRKSGDSRGSHANASSITARPLERAAEDYDVLLGYQVFLGRSPENSQVITERGHSPGARLRSFLISKEVWTLVAEPMEQGVRTAHDVNGMVLTLDHVLWVKGLFGSSVRDEFVSPNSWPGVFELLRLSADLAQLRARFGEISIVLTTRAFCRSPRKCVLLQTTLEKRIDCRAAAFYGCGGGVKQA